MLAALQALGYAEPAPGKHSAWRNTPTGNAVAGVSKAKPIAPKEADPARHEVLVRQRAEQAASAGKRFSTFAAREHYAEDEVRKFLNARTGRSIAPNSDKRPFARATRRA